MRILRAGILVAVLVSFFFQTAGAADTNPPPKLTFELRDGSRVAGTSVEGNFKFHSELLGDLKLAVKDIRSVECVSTNTAKLTTANSDVLTVAFLDARFKILTGFGKVELPADSVKRISVANLPVTTAQGGLVLFWSGNGDTKKNVGTDPDTVPSLNTDGPVMVRNNPALVSMQETRQLTFEAWIRPNSIPHEFPVLLCKGGNQPPKAYGGYELMLNQNADHDLSFISSSYDFATDGGWVNQHLGEWIHVAFTIDDKSKEAGFYVNGVPTNDGRNHGLSDDLNFDTSNNLYIGSPDPASHPNRARFDGDMRNVTLYNRVLTADEIRIDFETRKP
ncbi:MAG TPA: LamG domain-containing protein [Candidatus Sulfotelmatobacter sp.]|jgi:hypothetical protein|nr:LamG domain-containing protein [Candidatus Sulfotelmatobacter sp.]